MKFIKHLCKYQTAKTKTKLIEKKNMNKLTNVERKGKMNVKLYIGKLKKIKKIN